MVNPVRMLFPTLYRFTRYSCRAIVLILLSATCWTERGRIRRAPGWPPPPWGFARRSLSRQALRWPAGSLRILPGVGSFALRACSRARAHLELQRKRANPDSPGASCQLFLIARSARPALHSRRGAECAGPPRS